MSIDQYKCRVCLIQFDNFAEMQRHILLEHHQKGDITSEEQPEGTSSG